MTGKLHWGVDSFLPANATRHVPGSKMLYDFVAAKNGPPDFWGRYIGTRSSLSKPEAQYLLSKGCRILVIFNGFTAHHVKGDENAGSQAAAEAIQAANNLGVKKYTYIYANIEWDWRPSKDWIIGWWRKMRVSSYGGVGGFYCNPAPINSAFLKSFHEALGAMEKEIPNLRYMCPLFASGPNKGCSTNGKKLTWGPYEPPFHRGGTVLWQYAINCSKVTATHGLYDMDLATSRGIRTLWTA